MKHLCPECHRTLAETATRCSCGWELSDVLHQSSWSPSGESILDSVATTADLSGDGTTTLNQSNGELPGAPSLPMAVGLQLSKVKKLIASENYLEALARINRAVSDAPSERLAECMSLKGFLHYQLGEIDKAELACTQAIEGNWEDPNTFAWRAASRGEQNKWRLAFNDLHRACELTAPNSDQYLTLMEQYSATAQEYFHEQTKQASPSADIFCDRAWMYLRQGSLRKAERDFKLALSIQIDHHWSALGLAKTHHQAGVQQHLEPLLASAASPEAPIECRRSAFELSARINHQAGLISATDFNLHKMFRLAGNDTRQRIKSCRIRKELGFPIRSIDTLTKILETEPSALMGLLVRAQCYTAIKSYMLAVKDFTRFLNVYPDHTDAMLGRATDLLAMRRFSLAHEDIDRVLELTPDRYEAVLLQAKTLLAEDKLNEALAACEKAIRLETLAEGFAVKAEVYHKLCNYSESFEEYSRAIEFAHEDLDQKAEYLYRRGAALYELENFEAAYADFKKSSLLRPHHSGCFVWKAATCARLEKWHTAITALKMAVDVRPAASDSYHKIGKPVALKAIKHFDRLEKKSPKTAKLHYYRALAHQFLEDHEDAVHEFNVARRRDSKNSDLLIARAQSLAELEDHELARSDLSKVIRKDPDNHVARYVRANSLAALGHEREALADLKKAIEIDPNCAKYYSLRGQLYLRIGQQKKATRAFDAAIVQDPEDYHSFQHRGKVYLSMKQYRRAIRDFTHAIELSPGNAQLLEQRGQAYLQNGQADLALEDFDSALALNPRAAKAYRGRAAVLVNRGMHEQVLIWLTKALHHFEEPNDLAEVLLSRGKVFAQVGRWNPAVNDFTSVIEMMGHDSQMLVAARHARGLTKIHCGRYKKATKDFQRIRKLLVGSQSTTAEGQSANEKALPKSVQQIDQMLDWLKQAETNPDLLLPAILGPPIKFMPPTRPPVVRKGVVMDDITIERLQVDPPYSTWVLRTADKKEYGPIQFATLRDWLADGRVDAGSKLLRADWRKWKRVEKIFSDILPDDSTDEPVFEEPGIEP